MVELDGGNRLEEVAVGWRQSEVALGDDSAFHQREGVEGEARLQEVGEGEGVRMGEVLNGYARGVPNHFPHLTHTHTPSRPASPFEALGALVWWRPFPLAILFLSFAAAARHEGAQYSRATVPPSFPA